MTKEKLDKIFDEVMQDMQNDNIEEKMKASMRNVVRDSNGKTSVEDAIANGLIYVSIDLPNNLSNNEKTEFFKKSLKELNDEEPLPNGIYRLKGEEKGFAVEDGKLRLENW